MGRQGNSFEAIYNQSLPTLHVITAAAEQTLMQYIEEVKLNVMAIL